MFSFSIKTYQELLITWLIYWLAVMGFFIYVLKPIGINHIDYFYITIVFYISASLLGAKLFELFKHFETHNHSTRLPKKIIIAFLGFIVLSILAGNTLITEEKKNFLMNMQFYYPLLVWQSILSKSSELIFQQTLILAFLLKAKMLGLADSQNVKRFTIVFFVLHLPLLMVFGLHGLIFIIPSAIAGFLFSYFIINFKDGIAFSVLIHQAYYLVGSLLYRLSEFS